MVDTHWVLGLPPGEEDDCRSTDNRANHQPSGRIAGEHPDDEPGNDACREDLELSIAESRTAPIP